MIACFLATTFLAALLEEKFPALYMPYLASYHYVYLGVAVGCVLAGLPGKSWERRFRAVIWIVAGVCVGYTAAAATLQATGSPEYALAVWTGVTMLPAALGPAWLGSEQLAPANTDGRALFMTEVVLCLCLYLLFFILCPLFSFLSLCLCLCLCQPSKDCDGTVVMVESPLAAAAVTVVTTQPKMESSATDAEPEPQIVQAVEGFT
jgi:hypothetical protein